MLGQALEGKKLSAASVAVADLAAQLNGAGGLGDAVGRAATVLLESLVEHTEERLLMGGAANLTRNAADFGGSLRSILEALEEQGGGLGGEGGGAGVAGGQEESR